MRTIDEALKTFNLKSDFTHVELERAYAAKAQVTYEDFKNKKENKKIRAQDKFDYQLLLIFEYMRDMLKDIDIEKKGLFHVSKDVKEFYSREPYSTHISQLYDSVRNDIQDLDSELDYLLMSYDLELELASFKNAKNKSYRTFVNNMLYGKNNDEHYETIDNQNLEYIVSMKELILTVYKIVKNKERMLNDMKSKVETRYKIGTPEYNDGIKYYIRMRVAKSYEEMQAIYDEANAKLFGEPQEIKKPTSR